jgi:alkylation response protein AidB-like acyl-CoA dehydrogenase
MTPELIAYRERAAAWLAQHAPRFSGSVRHGLSFEGDLALARAWQALKAGHGYAGINLPTAYGGAGGTELEKVVFCEEEMRYDLPLIYYTISLGNPVPIMLRYATEEQRLRLGPPAIRGEQIWCQLFSEPAAGSDLAALRLKAELAEGGWVLNGQKLWTSWAQIADWGVIVTRTDPSVPKHAGLTYFFVDMKAPGITVRPIRRLGGERDLNEVFFDNVFVPDEQRLGKVGEGFKVAIDTLMIERYAVTDESGYGPTLERFVELARAAQVGGKPALADGEVRAAIANAYVERQGLRSIHRRAIAAIAAGAHPGPEGAIRKLLLGRTRQRLGALALDLLGADGVYVDPHGHTVTHFPQSWMDPCARIAGGTDEILLNTLAERILGLPGDYRPDKGVPFSQTK